MRLDALLPRPLSPETDAESPSILNCLLTGIHLDRRRARALGWRGVLPSNQLYAAWTCRVAGSPHVYGLVFLNEHTDVSFLHGTFTAHVFPHAADSVLDKFPLQALSLALGENYEERMRNLSLHAPELAPFCMGSVQLVAALDGKGLSLSLAAPARYRHISREGIAARPSTDSGSYAAGDTTGDATGDAAGDTTGDAQAEQWIVPPGGLECDVPAFRLLLPLFTTLAATAATLLEESPRLSLHMALQKPRDAAEGDTSPTLSLKAEMGTCPQPHPLAAFPGNGRPITFPSLSSEGKILKRLPGRQRQILATPDAELPVMHILTGFLGAGKTTFLRRWLDYLNGREQFAAVIQNEFGRIGLDAALTRGETHVEALDEGCVCCSLADSLRPGLQRLLEAAPAEQIILETTGLANPANVLESLNDLSDMVRPGLVITVADALAWDEAGSGIGMAQVAQADVIIANKADAVSEQRLEAVLRDLRRRNPRAVIFPAVEGNITFANLEALHTAWLDAHSPPPSRAPRLQPFSAAGNINHSAEGFGSFCLTLPQVVSTEDIWRMVDDAGPGLCRAKGIVNLRMDGAVVAAVAQYAAGRLEFEEAPDGADERYMVFIGVNLSPPDTAGQGATAVC
ncbi:MAG: GTP-binding protein [Desulfovibrio sp.]|uniref:CobW family GTP-binding protein n=1 Tax=Desulfovibrio sp. TaxID=885 RepID=UPI002A361988|nr:CobW family GTP-binding protein [Desulfovibrio sp.]MDY0260720.1 GTP-binding protein [Desulfovibrio sp.]